MFDNLKGIEKEREEQKRESGAIEKLLEVRDLIMQEAKRPLTSAADKDVYNRIYNSTKSRLEGIEFDAADIKNLIFARPQADVNSGMRQYAGKITGCILQILTERNEAKKEKTIVHIDGRDTRFDYLFYGTKIIDELIVENFKGNSICQEVCQNGGKANLVAGINIEGSKTFARLGYENGNVGVVLAKDIIGHHTLYSAGQNGKIGSIIAAGLRGNQILERAGDEKGEIGLVIGYNIKGGRALFGIEDYETIGLILKKYINNDRKCRQAGQDLLKYYMHRGYLDEKIRDSLKDLKFECAINFPYGPPCIKDEHISAIDGETRRYSSDTDMDKRIQQKRKKRMNKIIRLTSSMKNKDWEECIKTAYTIDNVYNAIKRILEK